MKLSLIQVSAFMAPSAGELALPKRGVVTVQGPNGAGKSRFVEAAAYCGWGETLRETTPWREDEAGSASISSHDGWVIQRTVTAKGTKRVLVNGAKADTNTKTNDWLSGLGDFEWWRRTHVFSSADAAHFSTATDTQRKDLLEKLLGAERFDEARDACSKDQKALQVRAMQAAGELLYLRNRLASAERQCAGWQELPVFEEEPAPGEVPAVDTVRFAQVRVELEQACVQLAAAHEKLQHLSALPSDVAGEKNQHAAELRLLTRQVDRARQGHCSECGSVLGPDTLAQLEQRVLVVTEQHRVATAAYETLQLARKQKLDDESTATRTLDVRARELTRELAVLEATERAHARYVEARDQHASRQASRRRLHDQELARRATERMGLEAVRAELADEVREAELLAKEFERDGLELEATARALVTLRSTMLAQALEGIGALASSWLGLMGGRMRVRLEQFTENVSGGIRDKIAVHLDGVAGGRGYKACSGGQRRRVDTALLLALAQVAGSARGETQGTLFFDEVFDALDEEGCAMVAGALGELGQQRCVVVITHRVELAAALPAAARYTVDPDGATRRL